MNKTRQTGVVDRQELFASSSYPSDSGSGSEGDGMQQQTGGVPRIPALPPVSQQPKFSPLQEPTQRHRQAAKRLEDAGRRFLRPAYDDSFKFVYQRDGGIYGIKFARDVALAVGFKPLSERDVQKLKVVDFALGAAWAAVTENSKIAGRGNPGKREPDIVLVINEDASPNRDKRKDVCIHIEMQNAGDYSTINERMLHYQRLSTERGASVELKERSPQNILGIIVLKKNPDNFVFRVSYSEGDNFSCEDVLTENGGGFEKKNVTLCANIDGGGKNLDGAVRALSNGWRSADKYGTIKGDEYKGQSEGKDRSESGRKIDEARKRIKERMIALSFLNKFSMDDFRNYLSKEIQEEFECMNVTINDNIKRPDMQEQLGKDEDTYRLGVVNGRVQGAIEYSAPNALREAVLKEVGDDPKRAQIAVKVLEDRSCVPESKVEVAKGVIKEIKHKFPEVVVSN